MLAKLNIFSGQASDCHRSGRERLETQISYTHTHKKQKQKTKKKNSTNKKEQEIHLINS